MHSEPPYLQAKKNYKNVLSESSILPINAANAPFGAWVNRVHPEMHASKKQKQMEESDEVK